MGDYLTGGGPQLSFRRPLEPVGQPLPLVDVSIGGGTVRVKVADNNKALPQDRIYFVYNHFNNAADVFPGAAAGGPSRHLSFNRYTVGIEKVFHCDHSLEVRVPFTGTYDFTDPEFGVRVEDTDNLTIIYKYLMDVGGMGDTGSAVVGLGVNIPSGADTVGRVDTNSFLIENESMHLLPYIGFLGADDSAFFHLFMQLDFVTNGNPVIGQPAAGLPSVNLGKLNGQSLFHVDASTGFWLLQDCPPVLGVTGLAAIFELHYSTALRSSDRVMGPVDTSFLDFTSVANRFDILNFTTGFHVEFGGRVNLGIGASLPLRSSDNRSFDSQLIGQLNYHF